MRRRALRFSRLGAGCGAGSLRNIDDSNRASSPLLEGSRLIRCTWLDQLPAMELLSASHSDLKRPLHERILRTADESGKANSQVSPPSESL